MKLPDGLQLYGDPGYRGACPLEQAEHITFFSQLRARHPELGAIALHPANEGKRHLSRYRHDVLMGLSVGAADIVIPGGQTFVCELKRKDGTKSRLSEGQITWLLRAQEQGSFVCVALGWEAAFEALEEWINNGDNQ